MKSFWFTLSDKGFELLKQINESPREFRDHNFRSLEDFKKSDEFINGHRTEESFKKRNFCDLHDLDELFEHELIECDGESWHITYVTSNFGKKMLKENS